MTVRTAQPAYTYLNVQGRVSSRISHHLRLHVGVHVNVQGSIHYLLLHAQRHAKEDEGLVFPHWGRYVQIKQAVAHSITTTATCCWYPQQCMEAAVTTTISCCMFDLVSCTRVIAHATWLGFAQWSNADITWAVPRPKPEALTLMCCMFWSDALALLSQSRCSAAVPAAPHRCSLSFHADSS